MHTVLRSNLIVGVPLKPSVLEKTVLKYHNVPFYLDVKLRERYFVNVAREVYNRIGFAGAREYVSASLLDDADHFYASLYLVSYVISDMSDFVYLDDYANDHAISVSRLFNHLLDTDILLQPGSKKSVDIVPSPQLLATFDFYYADEFDGVMFDRRYAFRRSFLDRIFPQLNKAV